MKDLQEKFGQLMGDTTRLWKMRLNEELKATGLSYAKWSTLLKLSGCKNEITQIELANFLFIEQPTLARVLNSLEKDGWILRSQSSTDRRAKIVSFTPSGKAKFFTSKKIIDNLRKKILQNVNYASLQKNIEILEKIFYNLSS